MNINKNPRYSIERMLCQKTRLLPNVPIIEIYGQRRILIENHCGIIRYSNNQIDVNLKNSQISILGDTLILQRMSKNTLIITGKINAVTMY